MLEIIVSAVLVVVVIWLLRTIDRAEDSILQEGSYPVPTPKANEGDRVSWHIHGTHVRPAQSGQGNVYRVHVRCPWMVVYYEVDTEDGQRLFLDDTEIELVAA